jgi:hypothetical protein
LNLDIVSYFEIRISDFLMWSMRVVGECPVDGEGKSARIAGIYGSKNAGMSSEIVVKNHDAVSLRFPWLC